MGNEIFIQDKRVCVQPLKSRLEAIQKLQAHSTVKGCRCLEGLANFLSVVLPRITETIKTYIQLDQKREIIYLRKRTIGLFEEIKCRLIKPPVLYMPNKPGRFHLYSDTSVFGTGSALYQIQN